MNSLSDAQSGRERTACCPVRDDWRTSSSIGVGDDGQVSVRYHAGYTPEAVTVALELKPAELPDGVQADHIHPGVRAAWTIAGRWAAEYVEAKYAIKGVA